MGSPKHSILRHQITVQTRKVHSRNICLFNSRECISICGHEKGDAERNMQLVSEHQLKLEEDVEQVQVYLERTKGNVDQFHERESYLQEVSKWETAHICQGKKTIAERRKETSSNWSHGFKVCKRGPLLFSILFQKNEQGREKGGIRNHVKLHLPQSFHNNLIKSAYLHSKQLLLNINIHYAKY